MIKIYDAQITDILPEKIASDIEVKCISYAVQQEIQRIMKKADETRTLSVIDELPEKILDVMAVELRTPYYQESMDIETKRNIIRKTLLWHTKAGTTGAVEELIEIVFGEGKVVEWFDYTEGPYTPGTFDIITNARMTEGIAEYFQQIIQRVKNTRSHIRRILIERNMDTQENFATGTVTYPEEYILNHTTQKVAPVQQQTAAASTFTSPQRTILNHTDLTPTSILGQNHTSTGVLLNPHITIENTAASESTNINETTIMAAVAVTGTGIIILNGNHSDTAAVTASGHAASGAASYSDITI